MHLIVVQLWLEADQIYPVRFFHSNSGKVIQLCVVKLPKERSFNRVEEFNAHLFGMLLYLEHLKECVGALGAAILLLVPSQNFLDVLLS